MQCFTRKQGFKSRFLRQFFNLVLIYRKCPIEKENQHRSIYRYSERLIKIQLIKKEIDLDYMALLRMTLLRQL